MTLPLSYSRLRVSPALLLDASARQAPLLAPRIPLLNRRSCRWLAKPKPASPRARLRARDKSRRRLVAREGLEPSKPLGRQIYSLLRLTASLPRQLCVVGNACCPGRLPTGRWSWRRESNPRPADYKSAALPTELRQRKQKTNFSTSCATSATACTSFDIQLRLSRSPLSQPTIVLIFACAAGRPRKAQCRRQRTHSGSGRDHPWESRRASRTARVRAAAGRCLPRPRRLRWAA